MLKNYITIALRNLLRQKGFAIINILGLTIGLTVSALIILYIVLSIIDNWTKKRI